ncbi:MAG: carboxynorspermidine decarboxylase [Syntrophales bacterium]|nr:carboxynorspermidine decarboxylase [Syntrophales bacterium]
MKTDSRCRCCIPMDHQHIFYSLEDLPTPTYVVDEEVLIKNLEVLKGIQQRTGCRILLALKAFAMFCVFPLLRNYLQGVAASSLHEARLGREEFGGEVHIFSPAYRQEEMGELLGYADHVIFNSFSQWERFREWHQIRDGRVSCGLRVNPEHSEVKVPLYDPCAPFSRLGVTRRHFRAEALAGIEGLHFHTLCELGADALARTLEAFERNFGTFIPAMKWVNMGGGHHITREDYDRALLCQIINDFRQKYQVEVYLEPGEAVVLNAGVFVASVLDIVENDKTVVILDASAAAHTPDVLEMPYRPRIIGADEAGRRRYDYRLGGISCLAGDVFGDYSFDEPLQVGSRLVFTDMAHYTMVKNNTFNGVALPNIALRDRGGRIRIVRRFGYEDYRGRLS